MEKIELPGFGFSLKEFLPWIFLSFCLKSMFPIFYSYSNSHQFFFSDFIFWKLVFDREIFILLQQKTTSVSKRLRQNAVVYSLGDTGFFRLQGIKILWKLQSLRYLRTLSLKFQKARTKIEVLLTLPCWLSQFSWDSQLVNFGPSNLKF